MIGKLAGEFFPRMFGPSGTQPLDAEAVRAGFAALARELGGTPEAIADGFIRIAVENMANAIKRISVARGYDARAMCSIVSAARAGSMPVWWPTRSA